MNTLGLEFGVLSSPACARDSSLKQLIMDVSKRNGQHLTSKKKESGAEKPTFNFWFWLYIQFQAQENLEVSLGLSFCLIGFLVCLFVFL